MVITMGFLLLLHVLKLLDLNINKPFARNFKTFSSPFLILMFITWMAVTDSAWFFIWQRWKFFIYWKEEMLYTNLINKGFILCCPVIGVSTVWFTPWLLLFFRSSISNIFSISCTAEILSVSTMYNYMYARERSCICMLENGHVYVC
jgi:hypothetical protein